VDDKLIRRIAQVSGTIWLIVEGRTDGEIVRSLLRRRYPKLRVVPIKPTGSKPNLSRLAEQIEELIKSALAERDSRDCVAVLHDADIQVQPDRASYERIQKICEQHAPHVKLVIAHDEIEAWLLADSGLCEWLSQTPRNCDGERQPSLILRSWLDKAGKPRYREENLPRILNNTQGDGDKFSPSMREAIEHLKNAPCIR
jgi:hypothetical protein